MNKFRTPQNVRLTRGLFYETTLSDKSSVVYTLKNEDHQGYPSLYLAYIETGDPTEYKFAQQFLDGWDHWVELTKCSWFQDYLQKWRTELEVKVRSTALANIMALAAVPGQSQLSAARFVLEYTETKDKKAGRPTKEQIRRVAEEHFTANSQITDDAKRLNIPLN